MVLFGRKTVCHAEVQLILAIVTIEQAGKQSLLSRLAGAVFVCPEFLHALPYFFIDDSGLHVGENAVIFWVVLQTLFSLWDLE